MHVICVQVPWPAGGTAVPSEPEEEETFSMAFNMAPVNHTGLDGTAYCHTADVPAFKTKKESYLKFLFSFF